MNPKNKNHNTKTAKQRSAAAHKAWETRRAQDATAAEKRSNAAHKAWATRRAQQNGHSVTPTATSLPKAPSLTVHLSPVLYQKACGMVSRLGNGKVVTVDQLIERALERYVA